jgi:hypothetical protein
VITHRQLLREARGPTFEEETPLLRVHMVGLRQKLGIRATTPGYIATEPGWGTACWSRIPAPESEYFLKAVASSLNEILMPVPLVMGMNREQGPSAPADGVEAPSLDDLLTVLRSRNACTYPKNRALLVSCWRTAPRQSRGSSGCRVRASAVERPLRAKTPFREKNRLEREASDG